jgi:DNA-binding CsgD family transcriptional regulator
MAKPELATRNSRIKDLRTKGMTYAEIGRRFDISRQRIHQIVQYGR